METNREYLNRLLNEMASRDYRVYDRPGSGTSAHQVLDADVAYIGKIAERAALDVARETAALIRRAERMARAS